MKNIIKNTNKKGFTIVELVIVIAVIAILAGVLIPTFSSVIEKANQSVDTQAVRQMNVALSAESVENPPAGILEVIEIVSEAGYNTEVKLTPAKKGHSFYWNKIHNIIVLVKDANGETAPELIYPREDQTVVNDFSTHINDNTIMYNLKEGLSLTTLSGSLSAGYGYTMTDDESLLDIVTFPTGSTATLDLGGNTMATSEISGIEVFGTLTIQNGEILSWGGYDEEYHDLGIVVREGGTLILDGVTVTATNPNTSVSPSISCNKGGTAVITNCTFNMADGVTTAPAIFNFGDMTISESYFDYENYNKLGLIIQYGTLTLTNVEVTSGSYCFEVSGVITITINGGSYTYNTLYYGSDKSLTLIRKGTITENGLTTTYPTE